MIRGSRRERLQRGGNTMNLVNYAPHYERLRRRRDEIVTTREHLKKEQRVVDENE